MENFFKGPNLGALREITFRRTADRTHVHIETARLASGDREQTWKISDTLLVCVGPSPTSAQRHPGVRTDGAAPSAPVGSRQAWRPPAPAA